MDVPSYPRQSEHELYRGTTAILHALLPVDSFCDAIYILANVFVLFLWVGLQLEKK